MSKNNRENDISFLGKAIRALKNTKTRIKEMRLPQRVIEGARETSFYVGESSSAEAKLSYGFSLARIWAIIILCVFLIITLIFGGSIISYENVYYMFRDIAYVSAFSESRPEALSYSAPFNNQDFTTFKNGLAVVGDSELKLFTSTGRVTMSTGCAYTNPKICASDTSVLVYDQGRRSFSVYNSFISTYSEELDYPISYADISPSGNYLVVTKSLEYASSLRVYDNKNNLKMEYSKNDHIVSAKLSSDGRKIAVVSLSSAGGESVTTLTILEVGKSKPAASVRLEGVMPYYADFTAGDRVALICSDSAHVYDLNCKRKNLFEYRYTPDAVSVTEGGFAIMFSETNTRDEHLLAIFDYNGKFDRTERLSGQVVDMVMQGDDVTVMMRDRICRIDSVTGAQMEAAFSEESPSLLVFPNGDVMVCTPTVAYHVPLN